MIIHSWNVNGYRAVLKKGFNDWLAEKAGDVVMLQEVKASPDQISQTEREPEPFVEHVWNPSVVKKGYSGTACFCREKPLAVQTGLPDDRFRGEGRVIRLEFLDFHLFNIYFPNGQKDDERLQFKMDFYDCFLAYAEELRKTKPIVVGGDFNTAHTEIDLKNPKANEKFSGFLPIEREWLDKFVSHGYVDSFRLFEPGPHHYSWWSYRFNARKNNAGWRIDYFFVSEELRARVKRAWIEPDVMGSDHCPVGIEIV